MNDVCSDCGAPVDYADEFEDLTYENFVVFCRGADSRITCEGTAWDNTPLEHFVAADFPEERWDDGVQYIIDEMMLEPESLFVFTCLNNGIIRNYFDMKVIINAAKLLEEQML